MDMEQNYPNGRQSLSGGVHFYQENPYMQMAQLDRKGAVHNSNGSQPLTQLDTNFSSHDRG